jgi:hypothetical protein
MRSTRYSCQILMKLDFSRQIFKIFGKLLSQKYTNLHLKYPSVLSDFRLQFPQTDLKKKSSNIKFHENRPMGPQPFHADSRDENYSFFVILRTRLNVLHWPINRLFNTPDAHSLTSHFTDLPQLYSYLGSTRTPADIQHCHRDRGFISVQCNNGSSGIMI